MGFQGLARFAECPRTEGVFACPDLSGLGQSTHHACTSPCPPPQGITGIRSAQCGANVRMALQRLWLHEHLRVYGDRLACEADAIWLREALLDIMRSKFDCREDYHELFDHDKEVLFGELVLKR